MSTYYDDEKLLMHFFQDSLTGGPLEWYMKLETPQIRTWRELVDAFVMHYQYNTNMTPTRTLLQNLSQNRDESIKEYAQRWREMAAKVQPLILER